MPKSCLSLSSFTFISDPTEKKAYKLCYTLQWLYICFNEELFSGMRNKSQKYIIRTPQGDDLMELSSS